jgi:DNA gyrase subunit A
VEGLLKALSMIDEVVAIIRKSQTTDTAKTNLMKGLSLSAIQAQAILDMPLRRLVSLERKKLIDEEKELKLIVRELKKILASEKRRLEIVIEETAEIKNDFATPRKTVIINAEEGHETSITEADLVRPDEAQMVRITQKEILRAPSKGFRDNGVEDKPTSRAVDIDFFRMKLQPDQKVVMVTNRGRMWYGPVGRVPESNSFAGAGLARGERIVGLDVAKPEEFLAILTSEGNIKRTSFEDIDNMRTEGSWNQIIGLQNVDDEVLFAGACTDEDDMLIGTGGSEENSPRMLRIKLETVNPQATPSAKGVIAIKMLDDVVLGGKILRKNIEDDLFVFLLTENGWIKMVSLEEYPVKGRGSQGVQTWKVTSESGYLIDFAIGQDNSKVDIYSAGFKRLRINASTLLPASSRVAKGQDLPKKYGLLGTLFGEDRIIGVSIIK